MGDHKTIARANFFWIFWKWPLWHVQVKTQETEDRFIFVTIEHFLGYYLKDRLTIRSNQPIVKIDNLIKEEKYDELKRIFNNNTSKPVEYQIRFYEQFIEAMLDYALHFVPPNLIQSKHSKRIGLEFMYEFYYKEIMPIVRKKYKNTDSIDFVKRLEDESTKEDINRIVKHYEIYLNDPRDDLDGFTKRKIKKINKKIDDLSDRTNPTAQSKVQKYRDKIDELENSEKDFSRYAGYINKFFNEMENYIKSRIPKRASSFQLSSPFKIAYLNKCNRLVQKS